MMDVDYDENDDSMSMDTDDTVTMLLRNNPQEVDELLSRELLELNVKDRNDIQEEIHGVKCLGVEETPQMIATALRLLMIELDHNSYSSDANNVNNSSNNDTNNIKFAYYLARYKYYNISYINTMQFRVKFLRCELFDIKKTATRIIKYLNIMLELFGIIALQRPVTLDDFTKDELRLFKKGRYQFLPFRDRSGRRILTVFPDEELEQMEPSVRYKIIAYLCIVAGEDIETQKQGIVLLVWFSSSFKVSYEKGPIGMTSSRSGTRISKYLHNQLACIRASAIHICTPDTTLYRFRRSLLTMRVGMNHRLNRSRIRYHIGEVVELCYKLMGYGIAVDTLPITWTGTIKLSYFKQWLRIRKLIEAVQEQASQSHELQLRQAQQAQQVHDLLHQQQTSPASAQVYGLLQQHQQQQHQQQQQQQQQTRTQQLLHHQASLEASSSKPSAVGGAAPHFSSASPISASTSLSKVIVECPKLNDILFRQGTALVNHPGNVRFRSLIEKKLFLNPTMSITYLINEIIDEIIIKRCGRVLLWTVQTVVHSSQSSNTVDDTVVDAAAAAASVSLSLSASTTKIECWCLLTDPIQINCKIGYVVSDFIRSSIPTTTKKHKQQKVKSQTTIFQQQTQQEESLQLCQSSSPT